MKFSLALGMVASMTYARTTNWDNFLEELPPVDVDQFEQKWFT